MIVGYTVDCSTGCSCCSSENHTRGPFSTREIAEQWCRNYRELPLLSSQYSRTGNYTIYEHQVEQLPDGRLIIDDRVFSGWDDEYGENHFEW